MRRRKGDDTFHVTIVPNFKAYRRIMLRRLGRLPKPAQMLIWIALGVAMILYGWLIYSIVISPFSSDNFTERDKCPACYGVHMCASFREDKVSFSGLSRLRFLHFLNIKNVFDGYYGDDQVMIKRLAHTSELQAFDERMCIKAGEDMECDVGLIMGRATNPDTKWIISKVKGQSDMMTCPSERLMETIYHHYMEKADAVDLTTREKLQLITTLLINQEPIILQTFSQKQGFPFPRYHGACGRMVVEEYVGHSLSSFHNAPWKVRLKLGYQIMKMADRLTDNPTQFSLYWTDLYYKNFAVDKQGYVKLIDATNIIVVDKWQLKKDAAKEWDTPYYATFDECQNTPDTCITVYPDLLCDRHVSDFNYYVACRNILSSYASDGENVGGLLHGVPDDLQDRYNLKGLLSQCAKPEQEGDRMQIKEQLLEIFRTLNREYI